MITGRYTTSHRLSQRGFTMVELAIALMVIGLLIAGLLKGNEALTNARATRLISEIKHYETAMQSFKSLYGELPGDLRNAVNRLPACGTSSICNNTGADGGDGNGEIGKPHTTQAQLFGLVAGSALGATISHENHHVWLHLTFADMINSLQLTATGLPVRLGTDYPKTPWRLITYDVYFWHDNNTLAPTGHYIKTKTHPTNNATTPYLSARSMAVLIDRKIDDGMPLTGNVLGWGKSDNTGEETLCTNGGTTYSTLDKGRCELSFRLSF